MASPAFDEAVISNPGSPRILNGQSDPGMMNPLTEANMRLHHCLGQPLIKDQEID